MHSFIVVSKDKEKGFEKISQILKAEKIDLLDRTSYSFDKAIGIEDVRKIQKSMILKPFKGDRKAVILDFSPGITAQAQNALLKTLEELSRNTIIVIYTDNKEDLLPTIISRCKIINLVGREAINLRGVEVVNRLLAIDVGEKMKLAEDYGRDRETALKFVEESIYAVHNSIGKGTSQEIEKISQILKVFNSAHSDLKRTNVNPRFILENLLLSF